jgi:uncharacterized membrane protein
MWLLGRRVGGQALGITLAYAWAAFPFTAFALNCNANDALVSALVCGALLLVGRPLAAGGSAALAGLAKFAPLALVPLLATHGGIRPRRLLLFGAAFAVVAAAVLVPFVDDPGLFYERTLGFQAERNAPFSVWGLYDIGTGATVMQGVALLLAVGSSSCPAAGTTCRASPRSARSSSSPSSCR